MNSDRRIGPFQFFLIGIALFALKFLIDRSVATLAFDRSWSIFNYLIPLEGYALWLTPARERMFYATMLLLAVPFVWIGIRVTLARLRDAMLPRWLALLFFVPAINFVFFAVLSVFPSRRSRPTEPIEALPVGANVPSGAPVVTYGHDDLSPRQRFWSRIFPENALASAFVATFLPVPLSMALTYLATRHLGQYGFGVFIAMPFALGLVSAVLHGYRVPRTAGQCLRVASSSLIVSGAAMLVFAMEGLGCLIMLVPLAIPVACVGGIVGYSIQARSASAGDYAAPGTLWSVGLVALLIPFGERVARPPATLYSVTTVIEVNAPRSLVWQHVVQFNDIPKPTDWIFRAGVAYPIRARIIGSGVGAIRYCEFSTGAFVEPIEIWDQPHLLKFGVSQNPPAMKEWSPFADVHPPHLDGFLIARAGEFKLIELPNGRTRIEGTTWYQHSMWPESYWRLWSDFIIHRIHGRVLEHIKRESEALSFRALRGISEAKWHTLPNRDSSLRSE